MSAFERFKTGFIKRDLKITWVMQVYNSVDDVKLHLPEIRRHNPTHEVVILHDGDDFAADYQQLARDYSAKFTGGEHLFFNVNNAAAAVVRILKQIGDSDVVIKIDPDARTWRPVTLWPTFECVFGTIERKSGYLEDELTGAPNVQGGAIGVTRGAALEIISFLERKPNVLLDGRWARCADARAMFDMGNFSDDFALTWLANELQIPLSDHPEIFSSWTTVPNNVGTRFAVTHPRVQKNYPYKRLKQNVTLG